MTFLQREGKWKSLVEKVDEQCFIMKMEEVSTL